jgi:hypothetical protein
MGQVLPPRWHAQSVIFEKSATLACHSALTSNLNRPRWPATIPLTQTQSGHILRLEWAFEASIPGTGETFKLKLKYHDRYSKSEAHPAHMPKPVFFSVAEPEPN